MNNKIFLVIPFIISGCDNSIETKKFSELSNDELLSLCSSDLIQRDLKEQFKGELLLKTNENKTYDPLIIDKQNNLVSSSDFNSKYRLKYILKKEDIESDFSHDNFITFEKFTAQKRTDDEISCSANLAYTPSYFYGISVSSKINYSLNDNDRINAHNYRSNMTSSKIEPTPEQTEWINKFRDENNNEIKKLKEKNKDQYQKISREDILYIYLSQSNRSFSDNEIMDIFSKKWNSTTDAFEKEEIKKQELNLIKEKISKYKDMKDILLYSSSFSNKIKTINNEDNIRINSGGISTLISSSYNSNVNGFEYSDYLCNMNGGTDILERGVSLHINKTIRDCIFKVDSEEVKNVSKIFSDTYKNHSDLNDITYYYIHINSIDGNIINTTLVSQEISFFDDDLNFIFKGFVE